MIVLVHGVPETADLWDDVRERLDQDSVAVRLPGFGCPRPDGFAATKDDYVDWLASELRQFDQPVDLVGHDWGGGLAIRVGQSYPELVRSWVSDIAGCFHPDYVWHDFAQIWQTPGAGEEFFASQEAQPLEERAAVFQFFGLDEKAALKLAGMSDAVMASCILDLYRSATPNPHAGWPETYRPAQRPCLFMAPRDDPFTMSQLAPEVAATIGAELVTFEANHFWPLQKPAEGARVLNAFIASL